MMNIIVALILCSLTAFSVATSASRTTNMTDNQKHINDARAKIDQFRSDLEVELLRDAYSSLEHVNLAVEHDAKIRDQMRSDCLNLWLTIINLIDKHIDLGFDRKNAPDMHVDPPRSADGGQLPPGADPAKITDPAARADYEKAIEANREKSKNYRMQIHLERLNQRIPSLLEAFIQRSYVSAVDRDEAKDTVEKLTESQNRKESLVRFINSLK